MNTCPDIETLIQFARDPLHEENAELAAHIYVCPDCTSDFSAINLSVDADKYEITSEDVALSKQAVGKVIENKNAWWRFTEAINQVFDELKEKAIVSLAEMEQLLCGGQEPQFLFAASRSSGSSKKSSCVSIVFIGEESASSKYYWRAELELPAMLSKASSLRFNVTDTDGRPLKSAKLMFQGVSLNIASGIATISFSAFEKCMKNAGFIAVYFSDGHFSQGSIQLLDK